VSSRLRSGVLTIRQTPDAPIAVVDEKAAGLLWPGEDPLGKQLRRSLVQAQRGGYAVSWESSKR
jgi:hypothetical protein